MVGMVGSVPWWVSLLPVYTPGYTPHIPRSPPYLYRCTLVRAVPGGSPWGSRRENDMGGRLLIPVIPQKCDVWYAFLHSEQDLTLGERHKDRIDGGTPLEEGIWPPYWFIRGFCSFCLPFAPRCAIRSLIKVSKLLKTAGITVNN